MNQPINRVKQLLGESAIYGLGTVISRFIGIILLPVLTRVLSQPEYGLLDLLMTISAFAFVLCEFQIISGVSRAYYDSKKAGVLELLIGTALCLYVVASLVAIVVGATIYNIFKLEVIGHVTWAHVLPILMLIFPMAVFGLGQLILRFESRATTFIFFTAIELATTVFFSLVSVVIFDLGVPGVLFSQLFSKIIWATLLVIYLKDSFKLNFGSKFAKEILSYGTPMMPGVLTKWGQGNVGRFILLMSLSLSDLSIYGVAIRIAAVVAMLDSAFRMAWDPMATRLFGEDNSEKVFSDVFSFYLASMSIFCLLVAAFGTPISQLVAGKEYSSAGVLVGFISFGLLWNGSANFLAAGNGWERKTYWNGIGFSLGVIVNLSILFVTAPKFGLITAGYTYLGGTLISAIVVFYTAQISHKIPYRISEIITAIFISISMSILFSYIDQTEYFVPFGIFTEYLLRLLMVVVPMILVVYIPLRRFKLGNLVKGSYLSMLSQTKN